MTDKIAPNKRTSRGFSLVEVLVALAIFGVVMGSIYSLYIAQSQSAMTQEEVVTLQKNLRAALFFMEQDLRMAGYNPERVNGDEAGEDIDCDGTDDAAQNDNTATAMTDESAKIRFKEAQTGSLTFTLDLDGDGDTCDAEETVSYTLNDPNPDRLLRRNGSPIAENIEAIYFEYLTAGGTAAATIGDIRQVVVTAVARTTNPDPKYTDGNSYQSLLGTTVFTVPTDAEHFRRQLLSTRVECRNLD